MPLEGLYSSLVAFGIIAGVYSVFVLGLNLHWGQTGLFNFGVAGFFAIGAYTSTLVTMPQPTGEYARYVEVFFALGMPFVIGVASAGIMAGLVAFLVGIPGLRLREDYLAIATIGFAETVRLVFNNERWLANGTRGLSGLPQPLREAVPDPLWPLVYLAIVAAIILAIYLVLGRSLRSPWGRVLRAIREDEVVAAAVGKNVFAFKLQALVLGAAIMGIGGALYTHYHAFLAPDVFDPFFATLLVWVMLILGGRGNNKGAILGALVVWAIWEGTRYFTSPLLPGPLEARAPYVRLALIGILLIAVLMLRPNGLLPEEKEGTRERLADPRIRGKPAKPAP